MPPNDPAASWLLLYHRTWMHQMQVAVTLLTAPWLAWQGAPAPQPAPPQRPAAARRRTAGPAREAAADTEDAEDIA